MVHDSATNELGNSHIETAIYGLFRVDILNLVKIKALLAKEFHIQPSEIDMMPAWEYELFMKEINNAVKEDNKRNETEMEKSGYKDINQMTSQRNIDRMQKQAMSSSGIKMPSMPKIPSMPKY